MKKKNGHDKLKDEAQSLLYILSIMSLLSHLEHKSKEHCSVRKRPIF